MPLDPPNSADLLDDADIVGRATHALRDRAVPEGPSAELVAQTRDAMRQDSTKSGGWSIWLVPSPLRLAAAITILGVTVLVIYHAVTHRGQTSQPLTKHEDGPRAPSAPGHDAAPPGPAQQPALPNIADRTPALSPPQIPDHTPPSQVPQPPVRAYSDGVISGRVQFAGVAHAGMPLASADHMPDYVKLHGGPFVDESLIVNGNGGLANVVVSISDGLSGWLPEEFPPRTEPAVLDQKGCVFVPHVVAVMVGQPLVVKNSDPVAHNVHVLAVNNPSANLGQPSETDSETEKFLTPEVFRITCDMHPWMLAWVRVVDNPYFAVTGPDGRFSLPGLPPGTYTLKAWHESLGVQEIQVIIPPGRGKTVDFTFRAQR